jgi:hypothetical protein
MRKSDFFIVMNFVVSSHMKACALRSLVFLIFATIFFRLEAREGFYKELFADFGVGLTHLPGMPAADGLSWAWEFVSTDDVNVQHSYMWGNANDDNGVLLYPDREPRFMVMYTGGGYGDHAGPVGATGIKNVQDFFYNGGSYTGTCNGNYMAWNWAYKLWPGQIQMDNYEGQVEGTIPDNSPLLRYYDFGGDHLIASPDSDLWDLKGLMHYSGGFETGTLPEGTEVLLIGKSHSTKINGDGHPTGYAYKPKATSGRVCGMNDHPEYAIQPGEVMNYLQAALLYARDGVAPPDVKASLVNGEVRMMNKSSGDNDPAHAKIGDKQYHHFRVVLPNGVNKLTVTLDADTGYDMNLYITKDTFAFASRAKYADTLKGSKKTLTVSSPVSGTWYIGVECGTTVTATKRESGYEYTGKLGVLNGVKYSIKADWFQGVNIVEKNGTIRGMHDQLWVKSGKEVLIRVGTTLPYTLRIFDLKGRLCWAPGISSSGEYIWRPVNYGIYVVRLTNNKSVITKQCIAKK